MKNKNYTDKEVESIQKLFGRHSRAEIANRLDRTKSGIRGKVQTLGIRAKESLMQHDYIALPEFCKEIEADCEGITEDNIHGMIRDGIIPIVTSGKYQSRYLELDEAEKWQAFFREYVHTSFVRKQIPEKYDEAFSKWVRGGEVFESIKFENRLIWSYWLKRSKVAEVLNLFKEYLPSAEFASQAGYTKNHIHKLIRKGVLTKHILFLGKRWFHKSELMTLKVRDK